MKIIGAGILSARLARLRKNHGDGARGNVWNIAAMTALRYRAGVGRKTREAA